MDEDANQGANQRALITSKAVTRVMLERVARLAVREETRAKARSRVAAQGLAGLDAGRLEGEWKSDVLACPGPDGRPDERLLDEVAGDPDSAFLEWLEGRLAEPYAVSYRFHQRALKRLDPEDANKFYSVVWDQEIAWARRLRSDASPKVAVLAQMFLRQVLMDSGQEFLTLASIYGQLGTDLAYRDAVEHEYTADQIRAGMGSPSFGPIFLRLYGQSKAERVDRMKPNELEALAGFARKAEADEMLRLAGGRAARTARRTPLSHLTGVISTAIEVGLDSDGLVFAESAFLAAIESGAVPVPLTVGLPYTEFLQWLRTAEIPRPREDAVHPGRQAGLLEVLARPQRWIERLPPEYKSLGGDSVSVYRDWISPLAVGEREPPSDVLVDYGFHLVERGFTRRRRQSQALPTGGA